MISAAQLRAARGLLDWTRADLAKAASVSPETIKNIEHGTFRPQDSTETAIIQAFASHDVDFIENDGVQKQKKLVRTFVGKKGFIDLLDHIYGVVSSGKSITRHYNFPDKFLSSVAPEYLPVHAERMARIENLDAKCLIPEGENLFPVDYCEYRWLSKTHTSSMPYYMYDDYVTLFMQYSPEMIMTVSVYSEFLSENLRKQFDILWKSAPVAQPKGRT